MSSSLHRADVADRRIGSLPSQEPVAAKRSMRDSRLATESRIGCKRLYHLSNSAVVLNHIDEGPLARASGKNIVVPIL